MNVLINFPKPLGTGNQTKVIVGTYIAKTNRLIVTFGWILHFTVQFLL